MVPSMGFTVPRLHPTSPNRLVESCFAFLFWSRSLVPPGTCMHKLGSVSM